MRDAVSLIGLTIYALAAGAWTRRRGGWVALVAAISAALAVLSTPFFAV
jgi:hypothetical protein